MLRWEGKANCPVRRGLTRLPKGTFPAKLATPVGVASYHKPKILALENVATLLTHNKGHSFKVITDEIHKIGYDVNYKILKCSDYGIPQMRKRLFLVCVRNDIKHHTDIFELSKYKKDVKLSDYLNKNFEKDYAYTIRCGGAKSPINGRHN